MNNHKTPRCRKQLSLQEKLGNAFNARLFSSCLDSTDHYAHECVEPKPCIEGSGRAHHRLLHRPTSSSCESGKVPGKKGPSQINPLASPFYPATPNTDVPIKTALARINSTRGPEKTVRVMFDDGSEKTWIRKGLADELRLDGAKETVVVATFRQIVGKPITSRPVKEGNNWVKVKALAVDDVGAPVSAVTVTPSAWRPILTRSIPQIVTQEECKL